MLLSLSSAPPLEESVEFLFSSAGFDEVLPEDLPPSVPSVPFELKELIAGPRDESTAAQITDVLTRVTVWVAGGQDASGEIGLAEARGQGKRRLEVYSHPVEVIAMALVLPLGVVTAGLL